MHTKPVSRQGNADSMPTSDNRTTSSISRRSAEALDSRSSRSSTDQKISSALHAGSSISQISCASRLSELDKNEIEKKVAWFVNTYLRLNDEGLLSLQEKKNFDIQIAAVTESARGYTYIEIDAGLEINLIESNSNPNTKERLGNVLNLFFAHIKSEVDLIEGNPKVKTLLEQIIQECDSRDLQKEYSQSLAHSSSQIPRSDDQVKSQIELIIENKFLSQSSTSPEKSNTDLVIEYEDSVSPKLSSNSDYTTSGNAKSLAESRLGSKQLDERDVFVENIFGSNEEANLVDLSEPEELFNRKTSENDNGGHIVIATINEPSSSGHAGRRRLKGKEILQSEADGSSDIDEEFIAELEEKPFYRKTLKTDDSDYTVAVKVDEPSSSGYSGERNEITRSRNNNTVLSEELSILLNTLRSVTKHKCTDIDLYSEIADNLFDSVFIGYAEIVDNHYACSSSGCNYENVIEKVASFIKSDIDTANYYVDSYIQKRLRTLKLSIIGKSILISKILLEVGTKFDISDDLLKITPVQWTGYNDRCDNIRTITCDLVTLFINKSCLLHEKFDITRRELQKHIEQCTDEHEKSNDKQEGNLPLDSGKANQRIVGSLQELIFMMMTELNNKKGPASPSSQNSVKNMRNCILH